jgi:hypothetical protein
VIDLSGGCRGLEEQKTSGILEVRKWEGACDAP